MEGVTREDDELNMLFSAEAAIDSDAEVVVTKQERHRFGGRGRWIDRLKAQGLKNIRIE